MGAPVEDEDDVRGAVSVDAVGDVGVARAGVLRRSERHALEVAAERLLALDRLEERLEVAVAEAARAVALDDLEEDVGRSWPVFVKIWRR